MTLPTDTDFVSQWYLRNTAAGEFDLNVVKVWDDYTGKGVKVFVFDDGFDYTNPDLAPNYDQDHDHDYGNNDDDAAPFYTDDPTHGSDNHGTATSGIIGAARNGTGVVGVSYDASLTGFRLDFGAGSDGIRAEFVSMLADTVANGGDVVNMSFGGAGSFDSFYGAANVALMKTQIDLAVTDGRDGLGLVLVKAAGNEREDPFDANFGVPIDVNHDSMDSDSRQIIVAALDRTGFVSEYSSYGAPVLISAFGSPLDGEIVTTDRVGSLGYNTASDDPGVTTTFNGTSAAAPMISGIAALMLQANADLGWRDVQTILAYSARHVGSAVDGATLGGSELNPWDWNAANNWNGGGLHYSQDYGYGLVDALAAVRMAESWDSQSTSANQRGATLDLTDASTTIGDGVAAGTSFSRTMTQALTIERVTVDVTLTAGDTRDLEVYLTAPDGQEQRLIDDQWGFEAFSGTISLNSQALRGESSQGSWSVRVVDGLTGDALVVSDIVLTVYGAQSSKADTYYYTNEFSDYAGVDGHGPKLKDTDGGSDTLNAAAVTAAMVVNLSKGTGTVDGVAMTIAGIENVLGGDGNDRLTGNGSANDLGGGRGRDLLAGGKGADDFVYNVVADSLNGKKHDLITDFGTGDHIDLSGIDTKADEGDQAFKFIGGKAFGGVAAELGFDLVDKQGRAHDTTRIFADLDGDKKADFEIELKGLHDLVRGDFIL